MGAMAFTYIAKGMILIGTRYSGESGARRLARAGLRPGNDRDDEGRGREDVQAPRGHADSRAVGQTREHTPEQLHSSVAGQLDQKSRT
ncbi:MAG: hypothetical protein U0361_20595 [Nitrospiraceae bacterium]